MSLITRTAARVRLAKPFPHLTMSVIAAEAVDKGQAGYLVAATGRAGLADANAAGRETVAGIFLGKAAAGQAVELALPGAMLTGFDLSGMNYGDVVFLSDTAGEFDNVASATRVVRVGRVVPLSDANLTKVLLVEVAPPDSSTILVGRLALTGAAVAAGTQAWQNPTAGNIIVHRAVLDVATQSSGACTLDIGMTPTSATTSADNLIDGMSVAAAGVFDNIDNKGTNGKSTQKVAVGRWVTVTQASGAAAGLVGTLLIFYTVP